MERRPMDRRRSKFPFPLVIALAGTLICLLHGVPPTHAQPAQGPSQREVANYVRDRILGGEFGERTLWMTEGPLDSSHVARDLVLGRKSELRFPYPQSWLVMIDDFPQANFAHPVRWVFIDAQLTQHTEPVKRDFPPVVLSQGGQGPAVSFRCAGVTPVKCPDLGAQIPGAFKPPAAQQSDGCLYAVLVSGGINSSANYSRYPQNIRSMYNILRNCGYPAENIFVYYADGTSLDLDNQDGDNNDATGGDVTAGANEVAIRARIQDLCAKLDPDKDVLFTYFTNHGSDDDGVCLWDGNGNGLDANELYSPAELAADTANCSVCRHFMIHDQCFAGDFLPMASDGSHANLAVYAAASATEVSWGRQYMAQWETNDPSTTTANAMHQDVVANGNLSSTPGMAEGTPNLGNVSLCACCGGRPCWIWIIILIILILILIAILIWWRRRKIPVPRPAG